ncbi:hypothetical protein HMPREF9336_04322 [Segniliparus rugosus ATCC BAA-974]|uniref:Uncharacterized protein n=2 Tax=Segniliparus rugosus TaxID=286804 RepID=U1N8K9_SEGRC|nr:hypothetical protein HMPREF9336_04322 [Segniliparus rugosus ATCC BAA-974]
MPLPPCADESLPSGLICDQANSLLAEPPATDTPDPHPGCVVHEGLPAIVSCPGRPEVRLPEPPVDDSFTPMDKQPTAFTAYTVAAAPVPGAAGADEAQVAPVAALGLAAALSCMGAAAVFRSARAARKRSLS